MRSGNVALRTAQTLLAAAVITLILAFTVPFLPWALDIALWFDPNALETDDPNTYAVPELMFVLAGVPTAIVLFLLGASVLSVGWIIGQFNGREET